MNEPEKTIQSLPDHAPWWTWVAASILSSVVVLLLVASSYRGSEFDLDGFGTLPIQNGGRIKPMDSLARTSLMIITTRTVYTDDKGKSRPAIDWLLKVMTSRLMRDKAPSLQVFRIENDQLLANLGLKRRSGLRYAVEEFQDKLGLLEDEAKRANEARKAGKRLDPYQTGALELANHLQLHIQLATFTLPETGLFPPATRESDSENASEPADRQVWTPFLLALRAGREGEPPDPALEIYSKILGAYAQNRPKDFNDAVREYHKLLDTRVGSELMSKLRLEHGYNFLNPLYATLILYLVVVLLVLLGWLVPAPALRLRDIGFATALIAASLHTVALITRMYIHGRPPVTNLYSSAVFIGWGCAWLGIVLESFDKRGAGNAIAAVCGFLSLLIAQFLSEKGDTLEMLQAVLDTNFWLATHVTCVTLGYTASFVAGFLGIGYVLWGMCTPTMSPTAGKSLAGKIYGVACFATLLSFVGTVLGGIWADQSWGRFWGWDPKENGALLIVIWNALILHARWGKLVGNRGVAALAIAGNMITAWSWFGTNQLSVGLHAYGFDQTLAYALRWTWIAHLLLVGVAMLPTEYWWSNRANHDAAAPGVAGNPSTRGKRR
ncbi:MAG: cytochrome C biogenesis protein [Planctomycetota bacterium]|nr:MAG: cytochrome C biogenesis protein [Planctomycetota bacterium]